MSIEEAEALPLAADCPRCRGLCCIGPAFAASADFGHTKPAATRCHHLAPDARCTIHADLRGRGYAGCASYDCLGAGQHAVALLDAAAGPDDAVQGDLLAAFEVLRPLHELVFYLADLAAVDDDPRLGRARDRIVALASPDPGDAAVDLAAVDPGAVHAEMTPLLRAASQRVRRASGWPSRDRSGADLAGADLRGADLRATCLRGAVLIGADLRRADLRAADLIGADLRGSDLRGANLATALFVTPMQVGSARGDPTTRLPSRLRRPRHWR